MDYREIIENLTDEIVEKILDKLEIPWQDKGDFLLCKTACHNTNLDEASWKLYYYKNTHIFMCYSECGAQNIFRFIEHYYETRGITYDWHEDVLEFVRSYGEKRFTDTEINESYKSKRNEFMPKKERRELPTYEKGILDVFIKEYPADWEEEGISRKAMDKFNIRFSIGQNKIIIPHYNVRGGLVGIRGRALNQWEVENVGKYMPVQIEGKWYSHPLSLNLYGLDKNLENIKRYGICYVFEAEKSVLLCENFSFPNCAVASCGSQFNKYQLDILMRYAQPKEIVICFDNEEKPGSEDYFQKLWKMCSKYKNYSNFSFIYDRENLTKKKDSPVDEGQEKFEELLKRRVIVK